MPTIALLSFTSNGEPALFRADKIAAIVPSRNKLGNSVIILDADRFVVSEPPEICHKAWQTAIEHMDAVDAKRAEKGGSLEIFVKTAEGGRIKLDKTAADESEPDDGLTDAEQDFLALTALARHGLQANYDAQQILVADGERKGWQTLVELIALKRLCRDGYARETVLSGEKPQPGMRAVPGTTILYEMTPAGYSRHKELVAASPYLSDKVERTLTEEGEFQPENKAKH